MWGKQYEMIEARYPEKMEKNGSGMKECANVKDALEKNENTQKHFL